MSKRRMKAHTIEGSTTLGELLTRLMKIKESNPELNLDNVYLKGVEDYGSPTLEVEYEIYETDAEISARKKQEYETKVRRDDYDRRQFALLKAKFEGGKNV